MDVCEQAQPAREAAEAMAQAQPCCHRRKESIAMLLFRYLRSGISRSDWPSVQFQVNIQALFYGYFGEAYQNKSAGKTTGKRAEAQRSRATVRTGADAVS